MKGAHRRLRHGKETTKPQTGQKGDVYVMRPRVLLLLILSSAALQAPLSAATFIVRPPPTSRSTAQASIGPALVGERYCTEVRCIVVADTTAQIATLKLLESKGLVTLQEFPEARKVFFGNATWDGETQTFDRDFPGKTELASNSPESLFAVVFKSFPQGEWLTALHSAGFIITEPLPTMAYLIYGDRLALQKFATKAPYIYRVVELPAGLRRTNLDTYLPADGDQPASTLIALVNVSSSPVKKMLVSARGAEPPLEYVMNGIAAYSAVLDRTTALYVSRFPEVVEVSRQTFTAAPSDERYNRIIAGDWRSPGSAWQSSGTIGVNTQPAPPQWYWENYLSHLQSDVPGFNLSNQTIAFLDTGVDNGLTPPTPGLPPLSRAPVGSGRPPVREVSAHVPLGCHLRFQLDPGNRSRWPRDHHHVCRGRVRDR